MYFQYPNFRHNKQRKKNDLFYIIPSIVYDSAQKITFNFKLFSIDYIEPMPIEMKICILYNHT